MESFELIKKWHTVNKLMEHLLEKAGRTDLLKTLENVKVNVFRLKQSLDD